MPFGYWYVYLVFGVGNLYLVFGKIFVVSLHHSSQDPGMTLVFNGNLDI